MRVGVSEYARHRGVTRQSVYNARDRGVLVLDANGKIDLEAADRAWAKCVPAEPEQLRRSRRASEDAGDDTAIDGGESMMGAQTRKAIALADLAEFELGRRREELVPAAEVNRQWRAINAMVRERLLALSPRVVPAICAAVDVATARRLLDAELRTTLIAIADAVERSEPVPGARLL